MNQQLIKDYNSSSNEQCWGDANMIWQQCSLRFRRSQGDLIKNEYVDPAVQQHMQLPPVLATFDESETPISVYYFDTGDEEYYDSDSEVECVALPSSPLPPLVPLRRYGHSAVAASA